MFSRLLAPVAALACCFPVAAQCGTNISGAVNSATWTQAGSPYCVTGTVAVANLTIDPGVEVRLAAGARLEVSTWLRALGTREQPIVFHAQNPAAGRWGSLVFQGPVPPSFGSNLEWCRIEGAGGSGVTILDNDNVTIRNCRIVDNTSPGAGGGVRIVLTSGSVAIADSEIAGNAAGTTGGGIHAQTAAAATLEVVGCRILENHVNPSRSGGTYLGGGIHATGAGALFVIGTTVQGNTVETSSCGGSISASGGGLSADVAAVTVVASHFADNSCDARSSFSTCGAQRASAFGGGIALGSNVQSSHVANTIVACNNIYVEGWATLFAEGSGLWTEAASLAMFNTTVARNVNGGLRVAAGACSVRNSILYFNGGTQVQGSAAIDYSNVQGGVAGGTGNFGYSPAFAGAGCDPEDFGLLDASPCVDAGDPAAEFDDGCQPPGRGTSRNDMGAQGGPGACDFLAPVRVVCAAETYGELLGGANDLLLDWAPVAGAPPSYGELHVRRATPNGAGVLLIGTRTGARVFGGVTVLLDTTQPIGALPFTFDPTGAVRLPVSIQLPPLAGVHIAVQVLDLPPAGARASNGLRLSPCY